MGAEGALVKTTTQKKNEIVAWLRTQDTVPSRKDVAKIFPNTPSKIIRAALASHQEGKSA